MKNQRSAATASKRISIKAKKNITLIHQAPGEVGGLKDFLLQHISLPVDREADSDVINKDHPADDLFRQMSLEMNSTPPQWYETFLLRRKDQD